MYYTKLKQIHSLSKQGHPPTRTCQSGRSFKDIWLHFRLKISQLANQQASFMSHINCNASQFAACFRGVEEVFQECYFLFDFSGHPTEGL